MQIAEINLNFDAKQIYMRFTEGGSKTLQGEDFTTLCGTDADKLKTSIETLLNTPETLAELESEKTAKLAVIDSQISALQVEREKISPKIVVPEPPVEPPIEEPVNP